MLGEYLPILLFLIVSTGLGLVLLIGGWLLGPKRPDAEKLSPYECGFEAFEDALEIAFVFPWALVFRDIGEPALWAMAGFLGILVFAFIYEWKKGALEWE